MSDDENITNPITKNELGHTFSTIIKSIIVLLIIGFIMLWAAGMGAEVYQKDTFGRSYTGGWLFEEYLDPVYGLIGIIIYASINYLGFLSYNHITKKFKNYKITISKVMFILFSIGINIIMMMFIYFGIFASYEFENMILEFLNKIIISIGWITFPLIYIVIYENGKKS